ncbi:type II toxin-antitoxin system RelB/DinJ family antitoxin, partial [Enterococcus hirae]
KIFLTKVVREKGIPFEMTVRKDNLTQALEEMKNEDYKSFDSVAELMKDLNDED